MLGFLGAMGNAMNAMMNGDDNAPQRQNTLTTEKQLMALAAAARGGRKN